MGESVQSLSAFIGRKGLLKVGGRQVRGTREAVYLVPVEVVDVKRAYGRLRFKVRQKVVGRAPILEWVESQRVELEAV